MIKKYIKLPIPVEALQWGRNAITLIDGESFNIDDYNVYFDGKEVVLIIHTLEGNMKCYPSDYIVRGVDGEFYPVKKEIFEKTYRELKQPDPNAVCFKDGLNCEEEWIKQEKELEKSEWVCVKKDRLEELIEAAYDYSIFCAVYGTKACRLNDKKTSCSVCKYGYDKVRDDYEPPVKTVVTWLEGKIDR